MDANGIGQALSLMFGGLLIIIAILLTLLAGVVAFYTGHPVAGVLGVIVIWIAFFYVKKMLLG